MAASLWRVSLLLLAAAFRLPSRDGALDFVGPIFVAQHYLPRLFVELNEFKRGRVLERAMGEGVSDDTYCLKAMPKAPGYILVRKVEGVDQRCEHQDVHSAGYLVHVCRHELAVELERVWPEELSMLA